MYDSSSLLETKLIVKSEVPLQILIPAKEHSQVPGTLI